MTFAEVNGTKLYYFIKGNGPPLMLLHGGLGLDHSYLGETIKLLENDFTVICYDMRANGRSDMSHVDSFTYDDLVDDADALREYLGLDKIFMMGHSAGGFVSLQYTLKYQQNLKGLILYDSAPQDPENYRDEMIEPLKFLNEKHATYNRQSEKALKDFKIDTDETFKQSLEFVLHRYFFNYNDDIKKVVLKKFSNTIYSLKTLNRESQVLRKEFNVISDLQRIEVETLILVGKYDFITPLTQAQIIQDYIPNSKLVIFEKSGHFPDLEEPQKFQKTIQNWLNGLEK